MSKTAEFEIQDIQLLLNELRRYEGELRSEFKAVLEREAARQEADGRWPVAGDWYSVSEIRRLRRHLWFRWGVVRVEALILIGLTFLLAVGVFLVLNQLLPK